MNQAHPYPGFEARQHKGWLGAHKWLVARRFSQFAILALFLLGPWFGLWLVKGNLSSSLLLELVPLTDPLLFLQVLLAGHLPEVSAALGALLVLAFYLVVGGRVYCSWVCPVNMVTDLAAWIRTRFGITVSSHISSKLRYWMLLMIVALTLLTGTLAWEMINPVSLIHRGIIFGMSLGWSLILAIFLLDIFVSRRAWCGHLCPVGAFYSLLTRYSLLRVSATRRAQCDDCMDCYAVCPEPQVIRPALKGAAKGFGPMIDAANCTNCGRCIDVCAKDVFNFTNRFNQEVRGNPRSRSAKSEVMS